MSDALGKRDMLFDPSIGPYNDQLTQLSEFNKKRVRQPRRPPLTALAPPPTPYSDYIGTTGPEAYQPPQAPPAPPQPAQQPPPAQVQQQQPNPLQQLSTGNPLANMQRPQAPQPPPDAPGEDVTASTRIPSPAEARKLGADPHTSNQFLVGIGPYMQPDVAPLRERHANLIRDYGGVVGVHPDMNADEVAHQFVNHITGNIRGMHDTLVDQWGQPLVKETSQWYEGANNIAHDTSKNFGYLPQQAAGSIAALSPQRPWHENVTQHKRLAETDRTAMTIKGAAGKGTFTPKMKAWAQSYIDGMTNRVKKDKLPQAREKQREWRAQFDAIERKPYNELTDYEKGIWARAHDEAHRDRSFRLVSPLGEERDWAREADGRLSRHSWGSFGEIGRSMKALHGDQRAISEAIGGAHKVRSFYNNIIAPWSTRGHLTNDTHAIAVGLMRPLGSKATEVAHGLGTSPEKGVLGASGHAGTGIAGMYPLYHEGYQRAAHGLWLPRQMQSITWEGGRALFSDVAKRNKAFAGQVHQIWKDAHSGRFSPEEARAKIIALATKDTATPGRIPLPDWAR